MQPESAEAFRWLLGGNAAYAATHTLAAETGWAAQGLGILTCIDSRLDPLRIFGLAPGDAKILRNAGARVTDDAVRSLAVACALLGVDRIAVVPHTRCKMAEATVEEAVGAVRDATGQEPDPASLLLIDDQIETLRRDVQVLVDHPLIPDHVVVGGFLLDLDSGLLKPIV